MKKISILIYFLFIMVTFLRGQELIIQENENGFCSMDGVIETSVSGYTGAGYVNVDAGVGKSISWNILAGTGGIHYLRWRYAIGGNPGDRPARLSINGKVVIDTVDFPYTGKDWSSWTLSDSIPVEFSAGSNNIRIEAYSSSGLGNYDYLSVLGTGISASDCMDYFILRVVKNNESGGTVSYDPVEDYYLEGTEITVIATPAEGYFFHSWSGDETSVEATHTFPIQKNTGMEAIFLPLGVRIDSMLTGYASVQDNAGTPYPLIGGQLGDTVQAGSFTDLKDFLSDSLPHIITISEEIEGAENVTVSSHKTLVGMAELAHIKGIGLEISNARNVIIKNLKISHVTPQDAIEINASQNIWIDHCELYSDREHDKDFYDGLLDIKNASSFITVSWSTFHDHFKVSLISSGDQAVEDTVTRITYHHNYFYNCESRLPSIRFGKAHIFNNYYKNSHTAINSRMGACVRVEGNYFNNVGTAVMMVDSPEKGNVELIDNYFGNSAYSTSPICQLQIPYNYQNFLDATTDIPFIIAGETVKIDQVELKLPKSYFLMNYPNPFNPETRIVYEIPENTRVRIEIFNVLGEQISMLFDGFQPAGKYTINFTGKGLSSGVYFYLLRTTKRILIRKMLLLD